MLEPYRRHAQDCPHKAKGGGYTKCSCPVWAYGELAGEPFRRSMKTRDWKRAEARIAQLEDRPEMVPPSAIKSRTVAQAIDAYHSDCKARRLEVSTLERYETLLRPLKKELGATPLVRVTPETLTLFRANRQIMPHKKGSALRPPAASTARKETEAMRIFFEWCVDQQFITTSPARKIRLPQDDGLTTQPYEQWEVENILGAVDELERLPYPQARNWGVRARALVLLLLYSGLRVSDVVRLRRGRLDFRTGYLVLRVLKNGARVKVQLPKDVVAAIDLLPKRDLLFGDENSKPGSIKNDIWRTLARLGKRCNLHVHPHRFRDTFACRILENGGDLRSVQHLLGHKSIKTTEKHYAVFVSSHQKLLDSATATLDFIRPRTAVTLMPTGSDGRRDAE